MITEKEADVVKEVGIFGLKTLLTLNSGAAIVLLTFVGNVYGKTGNSIKLDLLCLKWSMGMFLMGITGAITSIMITYLFAQWSAAGHPWIERLSVNAFLAFMVLPAAFSFLFFAGGFLFAIFSLSS